MNQAELLKIRFQEFLTETDTEKISNIWKLQSSLFRDFWKNKIMNDKYPPLSDAEIDEMILFLDKNAKGSTRDTEAVAKAMIAQGVWRRMFAEIKREPQLKTLLDDLFEESDPQKRIKIVDELYKFNEGRKNNLTGKSGNAINAFLFVYNPFKNASVISLNDRKKILEAFNIPTSIDFENDTPGKKIIISNIELLEGLKKLGIDAEPKIIGNFLYLKMRDLWREQILEPVGELESESVSNEPASDHSSFYMEKELENFLIKNWDKTELGKEYELIEENGELVSQQYKTDIGRIDILVADKKTKQLVVIELKRDQTCDDTVGQILRYMGWLEEHKTKGIPTKGIIIAGTYDKKLDYALKKTKDIQVFLYKINFNLTEFKS